MSDTQYAEVFATQLNKLMEKYGKTQMDLIMDLGFDKSAVSTWVNGTRFPRMQSIDRIAEYFHVTRSYMIGEGTKGEEDNYYLDPETAELVRTLQRRPELKTVLKGAEKAPKEKIAQIVKIIGTLCETQ